MQQQKMTLARGVYHAAMIYEALLSIPILSGMAIVSLSWTPLAIGLILHVVALVLGTQENAPKSAPILGVLASTLGVIPVLGWMLHVSTTVMYFLHLFGPHAPEKQDPVVDKIEKNIKEAEIIDDPITTTK